MEPGSDWFLEEEQDLFKNTQNFGLNQSVNDGNAAPKRKFAESGSMMFLDEPVSVPQFFTQPTLPAEGHQALTGSGLFANQLMFPVLSLNSSQPLNASLGVGQSLEGNFMKTEATDPQPMTTTATAQATTPVSQVLTPQQTPDAQAAFVSTPIAQPIDESALKSRPSQVLLDEVAQIIRRVAHLLEAIAKGLRDLELPLTKAAYEAVEKVQQEAKTLIEWSDKKLNDLMDSQLLLSNEMNQLLIFQQELFLQLKQLEIYIQELADLASSVKLPRYNIAIIAQPFPDSVKQHKALDEPLHVRLFTGARVDGLPQTTIRAEVMSLSGSKGSTSSSSSSKQNAAPPITLENYEKPLGKNGIAAFNDLKFPVGTRLKSIRLKFSTQIAAVDQHGAVKKFTFESNPTHSIVVKTNENQWHEAEGLLLKKTAFAGKNDISWYRLANWLQRRYLSATRQNLTSPVRPLSSHDLSYLRKLKFEDRNMVTPSDFDKFWEWFGPILHKIRYQRHICTLWTRGLICGFLTREEVDDVLRNELPGTFLIRFSERCEQFAVSYQSSDTDDKSHATTRVKHYLIKSDDIHGAKKTLPDWARDYKDLLCILQLWTDPLSEKRVLRRCEKDSVLKEFYSKKSGGGFNGYDDNIQVR